MILFATFNNKFHGKIGGNVIRESGFTHIHTIDGGKVHPAQKPLGIIGKLILDSTKEGDTVLDCFAGSGTTGVACVNLNRKFIGFELDEKYFSIAKARIEKALADKAQELF